MKKIVIFLIVLIMSFTSIIAVGCADNGKTDNGEEKPGIVNSSENNDSQNKGEQSGEVLDFSKNPLLTVGSETVKYIWGDTNENQTSNALIPVWQTKNVYFETVTFIGKNDKAKLLYKPTKIISVYDYGLQTKYEEGVDFTVSGNEISLTKNTKINHWSILEYYSKGDGMRWLTHVNGVDSVYFSETVPCEHQICVTYEHEDNWSGPVPIGQSDRFPKSIKKLKEGGTLNVGVIGDSITVGMGASEIVGVEPFAPSYANLVKQYFVSKFPNATVNYNNQALSGMGSEWGASIDTVTLGTDYRTGKGMGRFIGAAQIPDLFIVAWGMNDSQTDVKVFKQRMESIIRTAKEINPECEILFVSSMISNPDVSDNAGNVPLFEEKLIEMFNGDMNEETKQALGNTEIGVAPMTSFSKYLCATTKRYADIGSNNLNHANDFLHRIQAQVVLKTLFGDDFTVI